MPKFQIGEIAKLRVSTRSVCTGEIRVPEGTEVRVIGLPGSCPAHVWIHLKVPEKAYQIEAAGIPAEDGHWCREEHLEKLTGSWDELEKITGTKFSKTKEKDEILKKVE